MGVHENNSVFGFFNVNDTNKIFLIIREICSLAFIVAAFAL